MGARKNPGGNAGKGRPRGVPNKANAALKDIAQQYTSEAVAALAAVMRDEKAPHQARVAASTALLDRGHGKPSQAIQHSGPDGGPIAVDMTVEARQARARAILDAAFGSGEE